MIQYPDTEQLSCLCQALSHSNVIGTWGEDAARMVVGNDDRCRSFSEWIAEHLYLNANGDTISISNLKNYPRCTLSLNVAK